MGLSRSRALEYYLELLGDYESPYADPVVTEHDGVFVVRDDLLAGTKVRGGDFLASRIEQERMVYVQPRTGLAGPSLLDVCRRRNKKLTLWMPASKKISFHQAVCIEQGCDARFARIAAMPVLNKYAKDWSEEFGHFFIPLGLKHECVTAGIISAAMKIPEPDEVWTVVSTGVLTRALQIAWPNAEFHAVAVARNMKAGELGRANVISAPEAFQKGIKAEEEPPFPSVNTYDGKAWRYIPKNTGRRVLFWNVGSQPVLNDDTIYDSTDSYRDWGDLRDWDDNQQTAESHARVGEAVG